MTNTATRIIIIQVSSVLSMIGSCFVCLTTLLPIQNRRKTGKILLFWLCVCDFFASFVYFVQSFLKVSTNASVCKASALLGIYFPVSSFLWTDIIAFYLFTVVVYRHENSYTKTSVGSDPWLNGRLGLCHVFVWGICSITIIVLAISNQAGKQDSGTQWCWIRYSTPVKTFEWELVGGKFIEWLSCFIVLPFLYTTAAVKLIQIDKSTELHRDTRPTPSTFERVSAYLTGKRPRADSDTAALTAHYNQRPPSNSNSQGSSGLCDSHASLLTVDLQRDSDSRHSVNNMTGSANHPDAGGSWSTRIFKSKFSTFYFKMAAVPILFLFTRFWGSLHVLWSLYDNRYAYSNDTGVPGWLVYMQDAFDPSQGFFNAIVFVMLSEDGHRSVYLALGLAASWLAHWLPGCTGFANRCLASAESNSSSRTHPSGDGSPAARSGVARDRIDEGDEEGYSSDFICAPGAQLRVDVMDDHQEGDEGDADDDGAAGMYASMNSELYSRLLFPADAPRSL